MDDGVDELILETWRAAMQTTERCGRVAMTLLRSER
jgi:hypothetical protein